MGSVSLVVRQGPRVVQPVVDSAASKLSKGNNLSDLASAAAARLNLGLGSAATYAAGSLPVSTAQAAAIAAKLSPNGDGSALAVTLTGGAETTLAAVALLATDSVQRIAWDPAKVVSGARLRIRPGTYLVAAPITFSNVVDCIVEFEPGAILQDSGRALVGINGSAMRLPNGIKFDSTCSGVQIIGRGIFRTGSGFTATGSGYFDATNYTERRPMLWFDGATDCRFVGYVGSNPGVGFDSAAYAAIDAANPSWTLDQKAAVNARNFQVAFTACRGLAVDILGYRSDIRREPLFIGAGTTNFSFSCFDRSSASSSTWGSIAKCLGVRDGSIGPIAGETVSSNSIVDLIGSNIEVHDIKLRCPGKLLDISHEHNSRNQAMNNIVVRDCANDHPTGLVVTSVSGSSTVENIARAPITGVRLVNNKGNIRLGLILDATVDGHEFVDASNNQINLNTTSQQKIDYVNCSFRYTGAAGSDRSYSVSYRVRYISCRWFVAAGDATALTFQPGPGVSGDESVQARRVEFHNCIFDEGLTHRFTCNAKFYNTDISGITIDKNGTTPLLQNYMPTPAVI